MAKNSEDKKTKKTSVVENDESKTEQDGEAEVADSGGNIFLRFGKRCRKAWKSLKVKHPGVSQFLIFLFVSCGVTVLQLVLMPAIKAIFNLTPLVDVNFQILPIGKNLDDTPYYVFNYAAGAIDENGYGGGLAYFLAVQLTLAIVQVINFFLQRNITFKNSNSVWRAAMWYFIAYLAITLAAAALQGLYKAPFYNLLMNTWGWDETGETVADISTMMINSTISFLVFFPIFKLIFRQKKPLANEL